MVDPDCLTSLFFPVPVAGRSAVLVLVLALVLVLVFVLVFVLVLELVLASAAG